MMNCGTVWSCKWSALNANPHTVNSCWLLCYYWLLVFDMIAIKYCSVPFIVYHDLPPLYNHIPGEVHFATLLSQALIKKNNVMKTASTHWRALRQRTKPFPFAVVFSMAASMRKKDEVTFGCSINFKGFYTIKHNLSSGYYILPTLFLVSLWYFLLHKQNYCILILCVNVLVESVRLSVAPVHLQQSKAAFSCNFYVDCCCLHCNSSSSW